MDNRELAQKMFLTETQDLLDRREKEITKALGGFSSRGVLSSGMRLTGIYEINKKYILDLPVSVKLKVERELLEKGLQKPDDNLAQVIKDELADFLQKCQLDLKKVTDHDLGKSGFKSDDKLVEDFHNRIVVDLEKAQSDTFNKVEIMISLGAAESPSPVEKVNVGDSEEFFVAHVFSQNKVEDLREAVEEAFEGTGLRAYYADSEVREGHILSGKIIPKIRECRFGIYDVSDHTRPNVFLELGIAIGMGARYYIVIEKNKELPSDLEGLDHIKYGSNKELARELRKKVDLT